jgi:hypothetical protein
MFFSAQMLKESSTQATRRARCPTIQGKAMDSTSDQIMNPGGEERTNMGDFQPLKVDNHDKGTVSANHPSINPTAFRGQS